MAQNRTTLLTAIGIMMDQTTRGTKDVCQVQKATLTCPAEVDENGVATGWFFVDLTDKRCGSFEARSKSNPAGRISLHGYGLREFPAALDAMRAVYPDAKVDKVASGLAQQKTDNEKKRERLEAELAALQTAEATYENEVAALLGVSD